VRSVRPAGTEVEHGLAAQPHDERSASAPAGDELREGLGDTTEAGVDVAPDVGWKRMLLR
jgi:hypothetical protein